MRIYVVDLEPLELISDKEPGFRSELVDLLCDKLSIKHRYATPYYPQCNTKNEYFNGELIQMMRKIMEKDKIKFCHKHFGLTG